MPSSSSTSGSRSSGRGSRARRRHGGPRPRPTRIPRTPSPPATCCTPSTRPASRSSSRPHAPPAALDGLAPPAQLELLRRHAARSVDGKLLYGIALQKLGRQRSAERVFTSAAREAPADAEAQVAAAVGRFDKARPAEAFSRLGPLTRRFPDRATVRFHLGLLLLWSGEVKEAKTQLGRAVSVEPGSPLARQAPDVPRRARAGGRLIAGRRC